MKLLFETAPLSSLLSLEAPAVHAHRVHKMIKLDLGIDDNYSEDLGTASQEEDQAVAEDDESVRDVDDSSVSDRDDQTKQTDVQQRYKKYLCSSKRR